MKIVALSALLIAALAPYHAAYAQNYPTGPCA